MANTLYNLHFYIREVQVLRAINNECVYNIIANSCNFFLSEFEEMK